MWRSLVVCLLSVGAILAKPQTYPVKRADGSLCILATLSASFDISYKIAGGKDSSAAFTLPEKDVIVSTEESTCDDDAVKLVLSWGDGYSLNFDFKKEDKNSSWDVQEIKLTYNTSDSTVFTNSSESGAKTVKNMDSYFKTKMNVAYVCNKETKIKFDDKESSVTLKNLKVQAYKFKSKSDFSTTVNKCSSDTGGGAAQEKDITVPIAVGATLAILIVVLIIAYFVGKRSTREYQSI